MIEEKVKTLAGGTVTLLRPENDDDIRKLDNVETGTSFGDLEETTEAELEAAGVLEPDE